MDVAVDESGSHRVLGEIDDPATGGPLDRPSHRRNPTVPNQNLHRAKRRISKTIPDVPRHKHHDTHRRRRGDRIATAFSRYRDARRESDQLRHDRKSVHVRDQVGVREEAARALVQR